MSDPDDVHEDPEQPAEDPEQPAEDPDQPTDAQPDEADVPEAPADPEGASQSAAQAPADPEGAPQTGTEGPQTAAEGRVAWRRLLRVGGLRPTRANVLIALLAVLLGTAIATQVQLTNSRALEDLSQSDLVRVLDDISVRSSRLDQQVRELEATRDRLKSGTGDTAEAIAQAEKRVDTLGILAGILPAQGPGIRVTISDPAHQVTGPIVLDLVQELRDAGAEAIDIGGFRVVASTYIGSDGSGILVDGHHVTRPIEVAAIGDSNTLSSAMTIPGGVVETVRQKGGTAAVAQIEKLRITSVHQPAPLTHATPGQ